MRRFYFLGVDPAPSQGAKSDDGAIVVLRATPREWVGEESEEGMVRQPSDFFLDFVHARRVRGASAREWSGLIQRDHDRFGLTKICMDPGGGGLLIRRELAEQRQLVEGQEVLRTPIVTEDETRVVVGFFKLVLFKRGDPGIDRVWAGLAGDDVLVDMAHAEFREAIDAGLVAFPAPPEEWDRQSMALWPEEKVWALRNLAAVVSQLQAVVVATRDDGSYLFTRRNARQFSSRKKKDLAYAALYAYVAFLCWLRGDGVEEWSSAENQEGFYAWT